MNLFTRNSPYCHLLNYLLFLLKHPVCMYIYIYIHIYTHIHTYVNRRMRLLALPVASLLFRVSGTMYHWQDKFTELLDTCRSRDGEPPLDSRATPLKRPNHSDQSKPVSVTATLPTPLSLSLDSHLKENASCVDTRTCLRHRTYRHQRYKRGYLTSVLIVRHFVEQDN